MTHANTTRTSHPGLTRRRLLALAPATGTAAMLAGCSGSNNSSGGKGSNTLTFQTWANEAEQKSFNQTIAAYEKKNPDAKVELQVVPFTSMYSKLQSSLAAGTAPDLARIQYQQLGRYSSKGALLDLSQYIPDDYADTFASAYWQAITYQGKPYAVPHEAGGNGIYYNAEILKQAGITKFPQSPDDGWHWDDFKSILSQIKQKTQVSYPFAFDWQDENGYRWLSLLFQNGGQLLNDDLTAPAINDQQGIEAVKFPQDLYTEELMPPSTSIKSTTKAHELFVNGTVAMMVNGMFRIPFLASNMKSDWSVTYMIRNSHVAQNLGGNGIAATKDTKNAELAADFLQFLVSPEQQGNFATTAYEAPTTKKLISQGLKFKTRPKETQVLLDGVPTVPAKLAAETTDPRFSSMQQVLNDELEAAFKTGQSATKTTENISGGIEQIIAG